MFRLASVEARHGHQQQRTRVATSVHVRVSTALLHHTFQWSAFMHRQLTLSPPQVLSTPPDFLKDNEQALLQHYYDRLLEKGSGNATLAAYTKPQFDKDYANAVATVFAVMVYVAGLMQMGNKVEFYQPVAICADRVHAALSRWIGQIDTELGPFSTSYGTVPGQQ